MDEDRTADAEGPARFSDLYDPVMQEILERSAVTETYADTDLYCIYLATIWANVVVDPADSGLEEGDLEPFHDYLNQRARQVLGRSDGILHAFRFLGSDEGEAAFARSRLPSRHREFLNHIGRLILDPEGLQTRLAALRGGP